MKNMKKIVSVLLAMIMLLAMAMPAMAADTYSIKLETEGNKDTAGHTYAVYQIFTGTLSDNETVLSDVKYGENYGTKGNTVSDAELEAITDARTFADDLVKNKKIKGDAIATLEEENSWTATGLVAGYYLVVDTTNPVPEGHTKSAYIVQLVDDVKMAPKSDKTTFDKVITDDNYLPDMSNIVSSKYDNVSIGSVVNYDLSATIPANAAEFDFFYFIMNDTLSNGLTFNNDIVVEIDETVVTEGVDYKVTLNDGYTFQVALLNAKAHAGKEVVVSYTATLNKDAVIGEINGNPNTADLKFSNDPDFDYNGTDTDKDGRPDSDKTVPMGDTPDKITRTYTTGLKLFKVDENGAALRGAEFELTGTNVKKILVSEVVFTESTDGTYYKLKNGTYTTEKPQPVDTYELKEAGDRDGGYVQEGDTYREATDQELASNVPLYKFMKANADLYESTTVKYAKTVQHVVKEDASDVTIKAFVAEDGTLEFVGLGEGEFTIKETTVPDGYNKIGDITVVIDWEAPAEESNNCDWTVTVNGVEVQNANDVGLYEFEVENKSGATLPETGGMGTTIFYIAGGVLVVGAVVLMVTKKRMSVR